MADLTKVLGGSFAAASDPPEVQLIQAMRAAGIEPPGRIIPDGRLHRFGKTASKPGWYVLYIDGVPAGAFGDWSLGIEQNFRASVDRDLTPAENSALLQRLDLIRKEREAEKASRAAQAAKNAAAIWAATLPAPDSHPYLVTKRVKSYGLRVTAENQLVIPIANQAGGWSSLQYIAPDGGKKFLPGGAVAGGWFCIPGDKKSVFISEGYATACSVHEATGCMSYVAFSAHNLPAVAEYVRREHGDTQPIVIVADNDESGTGEKYGYRAADAIGARLVLPPEVGTDANDYANQGHDLGQLLQVTRDRWLVMARDFSSQPAPIRWLIKGWVQENSTMMVFGPSGIGKTFAVLDWALHIASGFYEWHGCAVSAAPVVYLAGEGHYGLRGRIAGWLAHHRYTGPVNLAISRSACDLNTPQGYQQIIENIDGLAMSPKLIVVDTLHRFFEGDENNAKDVKSMLNMCTALTQHFGCAVLLVHHTGLGPDAQDRGRGSSAWKGALDVEVGIKPGGDKTMKIIQHKMKDCEQLRPIFARLEQVEIPGWINDDGSPVTTAVLAPAEEPLDPKVSKKITETRDLLKSAWGHGGRLVASDGRCQIIPESITAHYLSEGKTDSTARKYTTKTINDGVCLGLITREDGHIFVSDLLSMMFKGSGR